MGLPVAGDRLVLSDLVYLSPSSW